MLVEVVIVQDHHLLKLSFSWLTDSSLDLGDFPDQNISTLSSSDSSVRTRQEHRLSEWLGVLGWIGELLLGGLGRVVTDGLRGFGPLHEADSVVTVHGKLVRIHGVELDPIHGVCQIGVLHLERSNGSISALISPIPDRDGLRKVSSKRGYVFITLR